MTLKFNANKDLYTLNINKKYMIRRNGMYKEILNAYFDAVPMASLKPKYNIASIYFALRRIKKIDEVLKQYIVDKETRRTIISGIINVLS